jgi:hypothetical protein
MKRTIFILFVLLSVGSLYAFKGHQQTSPQLPPQGLVNLDVNQQDVRVAIRSLFKAGNLSYTIAPDVQGRSLHSSTTIPLRMRWRTCLGR